MNNKLLTTYAVLAYLKETSGNSNKSIFDIFIPIVKKGMSLYSEENNLDQILGRSFVEIQDKINEAFGISIPIPVLSQALRTIEKQTNDDSVFKIHQDNSFIINAYCFSDIDEVITTEKEEINLLNDDFKTYCRNNDKNIPFEDLISFVSSQKIDLFTNEKSTFVETDSLLPQYLETVIKNKGKVYQTICNLYLGSLLASYFEMKLDNVSNNVRLLIDTNFYISLIDLNTEDAFSVCNQVFKLCKQMGYQFFILESTVRQIEILLSSRIQDFGNKDYIGTVRSADIFNACIRRNIQKTDLEAIKDSTKNNLSKLDVSIIFDVQVRDLVSEAKKSQEFKDLKVKRNNEDSALNDAIARLYVEKHRGNNVTDFSDVKCWFLHNSFSPYEYSSNQRISNRWSIGANELLVLLWLASPSQSNIKLEELAIGGIATYITKYRRVKTPSTKALKNIKQKLEKANSLGVVDEKTIYNLTTRMAEGSLSKEDIESLENFQNEDFVAKVNEYKDVSLEKDSQIALLKTEIDSLKKETDGNNEIIKKLNEKISQLEQDKNNKDKEEYILNGLRKCRNYTIGYLVFVAFIIALWVVNKTHAFVHECWATIISLILFVGITFFLKFINHTTVIDFFRRKQLKDRLEREFEISNK